MIKCIYCCKEKQESEEHVIPAGLGGDDRNWLLEDCVCSDCNTKVFSPLELKFLRSSPIAIARLFMQPYTRNRGAKTGTPTVQPLNSYFAEPETKALLEQELLAGGKPHILPQVVLRPPRELHLHSADVEEGRAFVSNLNVLLQATLKLVRKYRDGFENRFEVTVLQWNEADERYSVEGTPETSSRSPPDLKSMIWIEALTPSKLAEENFVLAPRVYQRGGGQVVCKVKDVAHAPVLLSIIQPQLSTLVIPDDAPAVVTEAPGIHQQFSFSMLVHDRVLAKIGMNLCAKIFGADFVRRPEFDPTREFVRTGQGRILKIPAVDLPEGETSEEQLNHHVFVLTAIALPEEGLRGLVLQTRLYGGPIEHFLLAKLPESEEALRETVVVVNDYRQHLIECRTVAEWEEVARAQESEELK